MNEIFEYSNETNLKILLCQLDCQYFYAIPGCRYRISKLAKVVASSVNNGLLTISIMNTDWIFLFYGLWKTKFQFARVVVIRSGERTRLKRTAEPCKVDKSNGIEIQINAALNDAYRISRL